ncbi:MAG TPA: amidohydrolase family protein, partial [Candidatus Blautia avistercoris]|nr:amidohydrolase family protein [Candidatus Blautia avistercoris]
YRGYIDLTTSSDPDYLEPDEVKASTGLKMALDAKVPVSQITFSSDGQGSLPIFDEDGKFAGLGVGKVTSLYREMKDAVIQEGVPLSDALRVITENPARLLKLPGKGQIREGADGDLVLADSESLEIDTVLAKGKRMISKGEILVKGTFE